MRFNDLYIRRTFLSFTHQNPTPLPTGRYHYTQDVTTTHRTLPLTKKCSFLQSFTNFIQLRSAVNIYFNIISLLLKLIALSRVTLFIFFSHTHTKYWGLLNYHFVCACSPSQSVFHIRVDKSFYLLFYVCIIHDCNSMLYSSAFSHIHTYAFIIVSLSEAEKNVNI